MITKLFSKRYVTYALYAAPVVTALVLLTVTLIDRSKMGTFFINGAFYADVAMVLSWLALQFLANRDLSRSTLFHGIQKNWRGLVVTAVVSCVIIVSVAPSFRVLADETNLLGVSKSLFYNRTAVLNITGKWYYEAFWPLSDVIERRPTLYPFFVSIVHCVRGFDPTNGFVVNALVVPFFVFNTYRFAKSIDGEAFGLAAGFLVLAHPIAIVSARSTGFDVIAAFFLLLVVKRFYDHCRTPSADTLALLWIYLCFTTHLRYEGMLTHALTAVALLALGLIRWDYVRPRLWLYVLSPLFLLPRFWQAVVKATDQEQPLSATLFSVPYLRDNSRDYLSLIRNPFEFSKPHNPLLLLLGIVGLVLIGHSVYRLYVRRENSKPLIRFALFAAAWFIMFWVISFSYVWGKSLHPAAERLFVVIDAAFSISAAYLITYSLRSLPRWVPSIIAASFVFFAVPVASEARSINELTLTRQTSQCWEYLARLNTKRIMVVVDRPAMYTVMGYGAVDITTAKQNKSLLTELSRHLFQDIYVIQEVLYTTRKPTTETEIWPDVEKEPVFEFQNNYDRTVRISRVKYKTTY
jgi:hypothetical protein